MVRRFFRRAAMFWRVQRSDEIPGQSPEDQHGAAVIRLRSECDIDEGSVGYR